jgi:hypothetical protein
MSSPILVTRTARLEDHDEGNSVDLGACFQQVLDESTLSESADFIPGKL